jgi:hypothetical protein
MSEHSCDGTLKCDHPILGSGGAETSLSRQTGSTHGPW